MALPEKNIELIGGLLAQIGRGIAVHARQAARCCSTGTVLRTNSVSRGEQAGPLLCPLTVGWQVSDPPGPGPDPPSNRQLKSYLGRVRRESDGQEALLKSQHLLPVPPLSLLRPTVRAPSNRIPIGWSMPFFGSTVPLCVAPPVHSGLHVDARHNGLPSGWLRPHPRYLKTQSGCRLLLLGPP